MHHSILLLASVNESTSTVMTRAVFGGALMIVAIVVGASQLHHRFHVTKKLFFTMLCTVIVAVTAVLVALTASILSASPSGVLERRTAQLSVSVCGQQLEFESNNVLSRRVGGPRLYEYQGEIVAQSVMVDERDDASLGGFVKSAGGSIAAGSLTLPTGAVKQTPALKEFTHVSPNSLSYLELSGQGECAASRAVLNVYAYRYLPAKKTFVQYRVLRPETYVFFSNSKGANEKGDCVVIEYAASAGITSKTCSGYPETYELGGDL